MSQTPAASPRLVPGIGVYLSYSDGSPVSDYSAARNALSHVAAVAVDPDPDDPDVGCWLAALPVSIVASLVADGYWQARYRHCGLCLSITVEADWPDGAEPPAELAERSLP